MKLQFGLRSKFFIIIAVIIGFIFIVQVVFQAFWLEDFYLHGLANGIEKDLLNAESQLQKISITRPSEVQSTLSNIRLQMDQPLLIASNKNIDFTYESNLSGGSFIAFKPENSNNTYTIPVETDVVESIANNPDFQNGPLYIEGYLNTDLGELIPSLIKMEDFEYSPGEIVDYPNVLLQDTAYTETASTIDIDDSISTDTIEAESLANWSYFASEGSLSYFQLGSIYNQDYTYSESLLFDKILSLSNGQLEAFEPSHFETIQVYDEYNQTNNLIIYKQLALENTSEFAENERFYAFSIISFASIEEPLAIYQEYNWITLLTGTVFALILVLIFTGRMVMPIKEMQRVTSKMTQLNFDERIKVTSSDEIGQLAQSFNVLSDKLKHSIDQMQKLNLSLEDEVQERTKQQVILKEFIGNASHELKTPITIMKGLMDGVEDGIYDPDSDQHKQSLQDEVLRMETIVYNLLQVSKMERGAQQVQTTIFEPSDLVYSTYQRHKKRGADNNMTFHFDMEDVFVNADVQLIESVVDNLIANAINYSEKGADVYCKVSAFDGRVVISVENTLAHIPKEDLPNIFNPFYRVDKSHTRSTGGTGLGLSIIKSILDLHKSHYELVNTKNGVKFSFSLQEIQADS